MMTGMWMNVASILGPILTKPMELPGIAGFGIKPNMAMMAMNIANKVISRIRSLLLIDVLFIFFFLSKPPSAVS
jgi:hypothetical protein